MGKSEVYFEDNTLKIIDATEDAIEATLLECSAEIISETARNTTVETSQLKNSWKSEVKKTSDGYESVMGSPLERAIWYELGTGEYALEGKGRKGYWVFVKGSDGKSSKLGKSYTLEEAKRVMAILRSKKLDAYYTKGQKPKRPFWKAYTNKKQIVINRFREKFGEMFK